MKERMTLKKGDEVRIIAPSWTLKKMTAENLERAKEQLERLGLKVTFSKNSFQTTEYFKSTTIEARIEDLEEAFADKEVKAIIAGRGGSSSNQLLDKINYEIIKNNPKIIIGYSDITALLNAIYTKTGIITYHGPNFWDFSMKKGKQYIIENFIKVLFEEETINIKSSEFWSNDKWYKNQEDRKFIKNEGMIAVNEGYANGKIIGGNLCTFNLLQGTEYMPDLKDKILFIEEDGLAGSCFFGEFDRNFQSLMQQPNFHKVKGIVIGRAETISEMTNEKWKAMIYNKKELKNIPIVINADIGHTTPMITFPIGGKCEMNVKDHEIDIKIM